MAASKRVVLESLTKPVLTDLARAAEIAASGLNKPELVDALMAVRSFRLEDILPGLSRDDLKAACRAAGLDDSGRAKQPIIDRLLGREGDEGFELTGEPEPAKKKRKKAAKGQGPRSQKTAGGKRELDQYTHADTERANNPPVGLVTPDTDPPLPPEKAKSTYRYDWHIDPALNFDPSGVRDRLAETIARGLADEPAPGGAGGDDSGAAAASLAESALGDDLSRAQAELAATRAALERARGALTEIGKAQEPYLDWAGKAEKTSFDVPTVSLHVHERIDPKTIIEAVRAKNGDGADHQPGLFDQPGMKPPLRDAVEFYKHPHGWTNRLVAGDSLLVMNSLLEKEGMAGKVQMVYLDPPYGIKYGSNFQPFVNKRDVKDRKDDDLTREPEMLKAFRDTWELGIHSYLAYLRDRLWLAKELLHESGSCFVQIGDENLHLVRQLVDEVFGVDNFVLTIVVKKKGATTPTDPVNDFVIWVAKSRPSLRFRRLFEERIEPDSDPKFNTLISPEGEMRRASKLEREEIDELLDSGWEWARVNYPIVSQHPHERRGRDFIWNGKPFSCGKNNQWRFDVDTGMPKLAVADRLFDGGGKSLGGVVFWHDWPYVALSNLWEDLHGEQDIMYVVQTNRKIVQRCMLMTTDPGDLVLDPTCGSGTTAFVAEQWGRRWITTDTSRVAITLAKQRLMTSSFDYYEMAHPEQGVRGGFRYKTVPHVTLKSIANNPEIREGMSRAQIDAAITKYAPQETLYDQPIPDKSKARVTGPFTVEAVPAPYASAPVEPVGDTAVEKAGGPAAADASIAREGETLRQAEWRDELLRTGVRGRGGQMLRFVRVEPMPGAKWLHAEAEIAAGKEGGELAGQRVAVCFGPEHAPLEQRLVEFAWDEARELRPKPGVLLFCAFQFDPEAQKDIDQMDAAKAGMVFLRAEMNDDLHTEDLKKNRTSNESFWLMGQPDIRVSRVGSGEDKGKWRVKVEGFDYFNLKEGRIESGGAADIAVWMLDTDYDGRSVYPRQVFFPMASAKEGWAKLSKSLKAEIDPELIEAYRGAESLPFEAGPNKRIAVKVVDARGIESLVVRELEGAGR